MYGPARRNLLQYAGRRGGQLEGERNFKFMRENLMSHVDSFIGRNFRLSVSEHFHYQRSTSMSKA